MATPHSLPFAFLILFEYGSRSTLCGASVVEFKIGA